MLLLILMIQLNAQQQIDVTHTTLNLKFDWKKRQAHGIAEITLSLLISANKIKLDAGMLSIKSVTLNNKSLQFNYNGEDDYDGLEILLNKGYQAGEKIIVQINYHTNYHNNSDPLNIWGSFGKGLRFFEPTSTSPAKRKQIWSSGEPEHNRYWFPCNEDIGDIHSTTFIATVEKPLMVIANGNLLKTTDNNDGTRTFHYETGNSYPNYLTSFVVGEYIDVRQLSNSIPIHNFGYPDEKEAVTATVALLPDMMKFISQKLDYPYPFSQYSQVVVQDYPFPGLNGQHSASILSDNYIDDYGVHKDFKYLWDGVVVQVLASQWFGNLIMPKSWEHIWLNNAFTQYLSGLFTAHDNGEEEYLLYYLPFEKGNVINDWNSGYKHPIVVDKIDDINTFTSDNYSKFRGALVLRMLQHEVGEDIWWRTIQSYVKTNAGKQVTTSDFQKSVEQTTGLSYQWFFDQWIYKVGLPKFEISKEYEPIKKQLKIFVRQIQKTDSISSYKQVDFFQGKVEIEIDNKIEVVTLEPKAENIFTFSMVNEPRLINFDYKDVWLCEKIFEKSFEELIYQAENDKSVLGRISSIKDLAKIAGNQETTQIEKEIIYNVLIKQVTSDLYWRYRLNCLSTLQSILPTPYNEKTISMLLNIIKSDKPWVKTTALFMLGNSKDQKYEDVYINALKDESDRVINAAAIALGKTKSPIAFDILIRLADKPSWKNQSRISALYGLEQLGDQRAVEFTIKCLKDNRSPRWYLATPVWDYPFTAANTLVALGKSELGYPIIFERFKESLIDNDVNDIFQNVQLIIILADKRGEEAFELLKEKFKDDAIILNAVAQYETDFTEATKSK